MTSPAEASTTELLRSATGSLTRIICGIFGANLWEMQAAIVRSVERHQRTSVKGNTAWGKTYTAGALALAWPLLYDDGVVLLTATQWPQVERQLMGEIRKIAHRCRQRGIELPQVKRDRVDFGPGRYIQCISPNSEEGAGGYHEGHVLGILDEVSGVRPQVHAGYEGLMSGGHARLLELGNPLQATGDFVDHHRKQRGIYNCFTVGAFDTPNFAPLRLAARQHGLVGRGAAVNWMIDEIVKYDDDVLDSWVTHPHLTRPRWVKERVFVWGPGNPKFDARVLGEFPRYSDFALIPLAWIEDAEQRPAEDDGSSPIEAGIDVAGPGKDETVLVLRSGPNILGVHVFTQPDARGPVVAKLKEVPKRRLSVVRYDQDGIGHYYGEALRDALDLSITRVVGIRNGSTEGIDTERFRNVRAAIHWSMRERFEAGEVRGLDDPKAAAQLATIEYKHDAMGRTQILPKNEMADSPDRAEAIMYAFWTGGAKAAVYDGPLTTRTMTGTSRYERSF
ncbi:MAG: hypothetical protein OEY14_15195 [Myxococcales bacterium]|nr:hypothetical protein [Myxococcales bacterium]